MKILHVLSGINPENGGPALAIRGLAIAQQNAGLTPTIVATYQHESSHAAAASFNDRGIECTLIGKASGKLSRHPDIVPELERLIKQSDVVHIHALFEEIQVQAGRIARKLGVPYVYRPCGLLDPWSMVRNGWIKRLYIRTRLGKSFAKAAAMHAVTPIEADYLKDLNFGSPILMELNGVDLSEFDPMPERGFLRALDKRIGQRPVVLFLSRISYKKGLDLLVRAFRRILDEHDGPPETKPFLVLAGPDTRGYGKELDVIIDEVKIRDDLLLTGMLHGNDRIKALADGDVFVLSSYEENFGIAIIEGLAAGLPVLTTNRVGLWPMIKEAGVGIVTEAELEPVYQELKRLLGDAELRKSLGDKARPWVFETFGWDQIAARWVGHYESLVAASTRSAPRVP